MVEIDKNIPLPERNEYPLQDLKVGESFSFPEDLRNSIQSRSSYLKKHTGKEFTIAKVKDGVCRVWRASQVDRTIQIVTEAEGIYPIEVRVNKEQ